MIFTIYSIEYDENKFIKSLEEANLYQRVCCHWTLYKHCFNNNPEYVCDKVKKEMMNIKLPNGFRESEVMANAYGFTTFKKGKLVCWNFDPEDMVWYSHLSGEKETIPAEAA